MFSGRVVADAPVRSMYATGPPKMTYIALQQSVTSLSRRGKRTNVSSGRPHLADELLQDGAIGDRGVSMVYLARQCLTQWYAPFQSRRVRRWPPIRPWGTRASPFPLTRTLDGIFHPTTRRFVHSQCLAHCPRYGCRNGRYASPCVKLPSAKQEWYLIGKV